MALYRSRLLRLIGAVCFLISTLTTPHPGWAADDTDAARTVVQSQVEAFKRNDANAAYSFASPMIRQMFPDADIFAGMVRNAYPPVYRHKRFEIGTTTTDPEGTIMLRASIVDEEDVAWEALYTIERQDDGSLKISGCVLRKVGTAV